MVLPHAHPAAQPIMWGVGPGHALEDWDKDSYCSSSANWFPLVLMQSLAVPEEVEGNQE